MYNYHDNIMTVVKAVFQGRNNYTKRHSRRLCNVRPKIIDEKLSYGLVPPHSGLGNGI